LLETQQAQNGVLEQFLQTQERVLLYCTHGAQPVAGARLPALQLSSSALPVAPVLAPTVRPAPARVRPPVPIPVTAVSPSPRLTAPARTPEGGPPPAPPAPPAGTAPEPSAPAPVLGGEGPPPTEQFRQDLLQVVSTRTGYPIDALDESLALEAALGIDSIKTVEIFSNLKAYHPYFRAEGQEEEELLAEFSKFKTLRDIAQFYDRRRQTHFSAPGSKGADKAAGAGDAGAVKRYTVAAVPAALEVGAKKNSLTAASVS
jgi:acyl carrier protein